MLVPPPVPIDLLRSLAHDLYAISVMADAHSRTSLLKMVEAELDVVLRVERSGEAWRDSLEILRACMATRSGLTALRSVLELLAPGEIATTRFVARCQAAMGFTPDMLDADQRGELFDILDGILAPDDLAGMFIESTAPLCTAPQRPDSFRAMVRELETRTSSYPLLAFLERVAAAVDEFDGRKLRAWIDRSLTLLDPRRVADLRELRANLANGPALLGPRTHLLVRLRPDEIDDDLYDVRAWLLPDGLNAATNCSPDNALRWPQIADWLHTVLADHAGALGSGRRPIVEFFVDSSAMNEPLDGWRGPDGVPLGARYPVVVRPNDRPDHAVEAWRSRWSEAAGRVDSPLESLTQWYPTAPAGPCCFALIADEAPPDADTLRGLFAEGVPIALWMRGDHHPDVRRRAIGGVVRGRELSGLPDSIRALRANGWESPARGDVRREYVLLWDDPNRLPPEQYDLTLPAAATSGDL